MKYLISALLLFVMAGQGLAVESVEPGAAPKLGLPKLTTDVDRSGTQAFNSRLAQWQNPDLSPKLTNRGQVSELGQAIQPNSDVFPNDHEAYLTAMKRQLRSDLAGGALDTSPLQLLPSEQPVAEPGSVVGDLPQSKPAKPASGQADTGNGGSQAMEME